MLTEKVYERTVGRAVSVLSPVVLGGVIVLILALFSNEISVGGMIVGLLFIALLIAPHLILLSNHWKCSKGTQISFIGKDVRISSQGKQVRVPVKLISDIEEFRSHYHRYGLFLYWKISASGKVFTVSNLVISEATFHRYFWNKIKTREVHWPRMRCNDDVTG